MTTTFVPGDDWVNIPDGAILPPGLQIEVDVSTGRKRARRMPERRMPDPKPDLAETEYFLDLWCAGDLPHVTLVAIKPDGPPSGRVFRWPEERAELLAWVERMNADRNVYFSVALADPVHKKPKKRDLTVLIAQHADLDPRDGAPLAGERARLLALVDELAAGETPPTFIVDSGGGIQLFYRLAEPIAAEPETIMAVEKMNQRLEATLGGKGTHNADRVMRLPGTTNWPNQKKLKAGRVACQARLLHASARRYAAEEIEAAVARLEDEPPEPASPQPARAAAQPKRKKANGNAGAHGVPTVPVPASAEMIELLVEDKLGDPELAAVWERATAAAWPDDTPSGWDYQLVSRLARCGVGRTAAERYLRSYLDKHEPDSDHAKRPDYYERTINTAYANNGPRGAVEPWPEPGVLGDPPKAPAFPTELLPGALRPWVEIQSQNMAVPPELLAVPLLVTLGGVIGKNAVIMPKVHDRSWIERPCLWGLMIMDKGQGKSPALREATAPINRAEARLREAWKPLHDAWKTRQAERRKAQKDTGIRGGDDPEPKEPKLVLTNTSIEAAADAMLEARGLTLVCDELSGWLDNMTRYSKGSDRPFWLETHSGGVYRVDRVMRGRQVIPDTFCGIVGGIQPRVARRALGVALDGVDDGLVERFGLACYPDPAAWAGIRDRAPERDFRGIIADAFDRLAATGFSRDEPLRFDPTAQEAWNAWYDKHMGVRVRGAKAVEHPAHGFHTKGAGFVLRLCVALHWFRWTCADGVFEHNRLSVDQHTLDAALGIYERFCAPSYRRIVAAFGTAAAHAGASKVAELIRRRKLTTIMIGDVSKKEWAGLRERKDIQAAMEHLEDVDWLRPASGGASQRGGRPTLRWDVNPRVHEVVSPGFVGFAGGKNSGGEAADEVGF